MRRARSVVFALALGLGAAVTAGAASAACTINSVQSVTGAIANLGRYSGTTAPVAQVITLNFVLNVTGAGTCSGALAFNTTTQYAQMSGAGIDKLRYDVQSIGGTSVLYSTTAGATIAFAANNAGGGATATASAQAQVIALASQTLTAGGYGDSGVVISVFNAGALTTPLPGASSWFANAAVNPSCTIGGTASKSDPNSVRVPVSALGVVSIAQVQRSYNAVVCNAPTDITMASQNGGIRHSGTAPSGFANVIDYLAQASFGGATATINTATSAVTTGKLNTTTGANGTMLVNITPQTPALPLMTGAYDDVLTITLTPQ
jgi:hypothetical protein